MPLIDVTRWSSFSIANSAPERRAQLYVQDGADYFYIHTPFWPDATLAYRGVHGSRWIPGNLKSWQVPLSGMGEVLRNLLTHFTNVVLHAEVRFERIPENSETDQLTFGGTELLNRNGTEYSNRTSTASRQLWGAPVFVTNSASTIALKLHPGLRIVAPPYVQIRESPGRPNEAYRIPVHYSSDNYRAGGNLPEWLIRHFRGIESHIQVVTDLESRSVPIILRASGTVPQPANIRGAQVQEVQIEAKKPGSIKIR